MSADNGTYVLHTSNVNGDSEFRVVHAQAIDNIYDRYDFDKNRWIPNLESIEDYFSGSKVFLTVEEAFEEAYRIDEEHEYSEYGVLLINEFYDLVLDLKGT